MLPFVNYYHSWGFFFCFMLVIIKTFDNIKACGFILLLCLLIDWVQECVTTASFPVVRNGSLHGFFASGRGLRQGDPYPQAKPGGPLGNTSNGGVAAFWHCPRSGINFVNSSWIAFATNVRISASSFFAIIY